MFKFDPWIVISLRYSIVIPAFNESERIRGSLERLLDFLSKDPEFRGTTEVLVVDDGSRDDTPSIVRAFGALHPFIRLIQNPGNHGKGFSVRNGMLHATGEMMLFSDADFSSPIEEAPKLFAALKGGADVAIGSRWIDPATQTVRQSFFRQLIGRVFNLLLHVFLGIREKDTQCGFKAFNRRAADEIFSRQRVERWGFDPELIFLAHRFGFKVAEIPVRWSHDERSKLNPVADGFKMGMEVLKIRWDALIGRYRKRQFSMPPSTPKSGI